MSHLTLLQTMFPGKILLGVEEIASLLNVSKGHIQNLCYANKLPLKLHVDKSLSNRIQVSIVEMARYLDSKLDAVPVKEESKEPPVPSLVVKSKRGRPRGVSRTQMSFQNALSFAVLKQEVLLETEKFFQYIDEINVGADDEKCQQKIQSLKDDIKEAGKKLEVAINFYILEKQIGKKPVSKPVVKKI